MIILLSLYLSMFSTKDIVQEYSVLETPFHANRKVSLPYSVGGHLPRWLFFGVSSSR